MRDALRRWLIQAWFDWMVEPLFREQRAHLPRYRWRMKVFMWLDGQEEPDWEADQLPGLPPSVIDASHLFTPPGSPCWKCRDTRVIAVGMVLDGEGEWVDCDICNKGTT